MAVGVAVKESEFAVRPAERQFPRHVGHQTVYIISGYRADPHRVKRVPAVKIIGSVDFFHAGELGGRGGGGSRFTGSEREAAQAEHQHRDQEISFLVIGMFLLQYCFLFGVYWPAGIHAPLFFGRAV